MKTRSEKQDKRTLTHKWSEAFCSLWPAHEKNIALLKCSFFKPVSEDENDLIAIWKTNLDEDVCPVVRISKLTGEIGIESKAFHESPINFNNERLYGFLHIHSTKENEGLKIDEY